MYYDGTPLYPFGHGLSYSRFRYSKLRLGARVVGSYGTLPVRVDVTNRSDRPGDEVVQLYVRDPVASVARPDKELLGFQRISIPAYETRTVHFDLDLRELAFWDEARDQFHVEPGTFDVLVGASSEDIRLRRSFYVETRSDLPTNPK